MVKQKYETSVSLSPGFHQAKTHVRPLRAGFPAAPARRQQLPSYRMPIRQHEQRGQLRGVLGQAAVVHLGEAEPVFHHPERALDSGLQWRGPMVDLTLPPWQLFSRNENATASD